MCCGNGCKDGAGNFTYIAYATDINGSDFARTQNYAGTKRCWTAIVTSPKALDENSALFPNNFAGKYYYICGSTTEDSDCCCTIYPFIKFDGGSTNTKVLDNASGTIYFEQDPLVENSARFIEPADEDIWLISDNVKDSDGNNLQNLIDYYFEFELDANNLLADEYMIIRLGDGVSSVPYTVDMNTPVGLNKGVIKAHTGVSFDCASLTVEMVIVNSVGHLGLRINNFRFGTASCFSEDNSVVDFGKLQIFKADGNTNRNAVEVNDMVFGWITTNTFLKGCVFGGGLISDIDNWSGESLTL